MSADTATDNILRAPHRIEFPYTRSLGPALSRFLTGLRDGKVVGSKTPSGKVHVPPLEFDPETTATISEYVEVGQAGVVTSWAWVKEPRKTHPLDHAFAFALVQLDGTDVAMLHAVDAGCEDNMKTGMRVKIRWAAERTGSILDIACFEAEASA
jgi:uncharacterized OB-fold protein